MIKPPFNYTGNKNRLIEQFSTFYFPKQKNIKFLDLFGGGGTIAVNVKYDSIIYNDINSWVVQLLKIFKKINLEEILGYFEHLVDKYNFTSTHIFGERIYKNARENNNGLKNKNEIAFKKLREKINKDIINDNFNNEHFLEILFLSFYSFNNDIRFNKKGLINIPIGKTDYNTNNYEKVITFYSAINSKKIKIMSKDFKNIKLNNFDFVYADPPYLSTDAVYNSNWTFESEMLLRKKLVSLHNDGKEFVLSNMSWIKGVKNTSLLEWAREHKFKVIDIEYSYKASSYNRVRTEKDQEVIITNVKNI